MERNMRNIGAIVGLVEGLADVGEGEIVDIKCSEKCKNALKAGEKISKKYFFLNQKVKIIS